MGALGITATATAIAIATAVISVGLSMAAAYAMKAVGLTMGAPKAKFSGTPTVFRQSISDSFIVYGKRRVGGLLAFFHSEKSGSDHYRYFVIAVAGHRCQGVVTWMMNDQAVTVNAGTGAVTSGPYAGNAWLWFQRGLDSETANATFVSECNGKWTSAHKGNGIAAIYAKFKMTDDVVQSGMPNITAIIEGKDDILDTRDDSVGYTNNAALDFYDWMKLPREEGGFGAYDDEIPDDAYISAQANVCDETVDGEARYAFDGVMVTGASPAEIRDVLVVNCAGSFTYSGGKFLMRPGYYVPPSETLSENDLAGPIQVSAFAAGDVSANQVSGTYISPSDGYQGMPFPTQSIEADDIRQLDLDLAFVTSAYRAERIASIMLKRAQAEKTVVWPMNISGLRVQALDTVQLDSARYGLSNYAWQIGNWSLSSDYGVVLSLREENEEIYEDPTPTVIDATPEVDVPDPLQPGYEISILINTSFITDSDPADGLLTATDTLVTIETHTRSYSDKAPVTVNGGTVAVVAPEGELNHIYYDDPNRVGGGVSYMATTDSMIAANGSVNPARHYVGSVPTDVVGGTGTSSGGATPPGWYAPNYNCVTLDALILMADGSLKPAGEVVVGDLVHTQHEQTMEWGDYRVSHVRFVPCDDVWEYEGLKASAEHPIWQDGGWVAMRDRGFRTDPAAVAKFTIEDAHTYVANGILSHNKMAEEP